MKEKVNPNHKMGKQTGYELIDGEYHIAPMYQEQFEKYKIKVEGIQIMLNGVARHASEELAELAHYKKRIWESLAEDIGLDPSVDWTYDRGIVKRKVENAQADRG